MAAIVLTLIIAILGGLVTGYIMRKVGEKMSLKQHGVTVAHLVLNVGNITSGLAGSKMALTPDMLYDDNAYFHVEHEE